MVILIGVTAGDLIERLSDGGKGRFHKIMSWFTVKNILYSELMKYPHTQAVGERTMDVDGASTSVSSKEMDIVTGKLKVLMEGPDKVLWHDLVMWTMFTCLCSVHSGCGH